ncbi:hypothetical protein EB118_14010, partial [bacterium]|nr:hypothetical protein [bacterium]
GKRGSRNNNEVWAGRLVNNSSKLATLSKEIYDIDRDFNPSTGGVLVISEPIYQIYRTKHEFAIMHCGHDLSGNPQPRSELWRRIDTSNYDYVHDDVAYYAPGLWCDICQDTVNEGLLA